MGSVRRRSERGRCSGCVKRPGRSLLIGTFETTTDVDVLTIRLPVATPLSVDCSAQRSGSGPRGFKGSVFASDGTTLRTAGLTVTEDASNDVHLSKLALGSESTKIVIKLEATLPQNTNVTSTYYTCTMAFK